MGDELQNATTDVPALASVAKAPPALAELHVVHPPELATTIALKSARVTLGRQPDDDSAPPLLHRLVSRKHFAIEWDPQRHLHTGVDLGSSNGSAVDGVPATNKIALRDGSVLRVGPLLLVYELPAQVAAADTAQVSREAIPGRAAAARYLRAEVARVAPDPSPVLLYGATGTGKEFIAHEIHRLSGRAGKLVAVNCAALSAQLVESELFGHVRGAFSGAQQDQSGLFRAADGGTLLLDEIGELPLELQPKLLRALQERCVRPVGATRDVAVDVRVIAATNRDLASATPRGEFRRDLYARLSLWEIRVPGLRRRRADVLLWLARFHAAFRAARGLPAQPPPELETEAAEALLLRDFPDNLRGLDRLAHALSPLEDAGRPLSIADLPAWLWNEPGRGSAPPAMIAAIPGRSVAPASSSAPPAMSSAPPAMSSERPKIPTRDELAAALAQHDGSIRATARHFGRDRRQIYRWMEAFGLKGKDG